MYVCLYVAKYLVHHHITACFLLAHLHAGNLRILKKKKTGTYTLCTTHSQLALHQLLLNLGQQRPAIRQNDLPTVHARPENHFLASIRVLPTGQPHLSNQPVTGHDRRRKTSLELLQPSGIRGAKSLQHSVRGYIPRAKAM
jgi:hypothetical protein